MNSKIVWSEVLITKRKPEGRKASSDDALLLTADLAKIWIKNHNIIIRSEK